MLRKCVITRYDGRIKEPPFFTLPIDSMEVDEPDVDDMGEKFADSLMVECLIRGYKFRFHSYAQGEVYKDYDYEVVVE